MSKFRLMKPLSIGKDIPLEKVLLPVFASTKLDGIRGCVQGGVVLSNSGLPIASQYVQERFGLPGFENMDGELGYGDPTDPLFYNKTQSAVNSIHWPKDMDKNELRFFVFDQRTQGNAKERLQKLQERLFIINSNHYSGAIFVEQKLLSSHDEIDSFYLDCCNRGFEGAMFKRTLGPYKQGRAAKGDQVLLRLKPFGNEFFEAQIIGYECAYHNANDLHYSPQGFAKRSSAVDGKVPLDMLGSFVVQDTQSGIEFKLPVSSMSHADRIKIWPVIDGYVGKYVRYTCLTYGAKVKPRMPSYRGFRDLSDFCPKNSF